MSSDVLIIEDEFLIAELVKMNLGLRGISSEVACTGKEGIAIFDSENPSVVILDVRLPDIDGWEVCKILKQINPAPVVIFMTAATQARDHQLALEVGADDFIEKPFDIEKLIAKIKAHLESRKR